MITDHFLKEIALLQGSLRLADDAVAARDQTIEQLRGELSLAEEGLANATQEIQGLHAALDDARKMNYEFECSRLISENTQLNSHCADLSRQHHVALDEIERLRRRVWALTTLLHPGW